MEFGAGSAVEAAAREEAAMRLAVPALAVEVRAAAQFERAVAREVRLETLPLGAALRLCRT